MKASVILLLILPASLLFAQNSAYSPGTYGNSPVAADAILSRFRLEVNGGTGTLTGSTKEAKKTLVSLGVTRSQADKYYGHLVSNSAFGISAGYFISPRYALGIDYQFYHNHAGFTGDFDVQDGYSMYYGKYSESIYTNYAGISVLYKRCFGLSEKWFYTMNWSLGMVFYRDESNIINIPALVTGNTFATSASIGAEYFVGKRVSLGARVSVFAGSLRKVTINDGNSTQKVTLEKGSYEDLSRINALLSCNIYL